MSRTGSAFARAAAGIPRTRAWGMRLAFGAACISGVAIFLNAAGVRAFRDATLYTTVKNLVAAVVLLGLAGLARLRGSVASPVRPRRPAQWIGLAAVAVIGGSVPFVLFFQGLAHATSTQAAFLQKTLVIWVALLAVPLLGERLGLVHVAAIGLLVWGQAALGGGVGGLRAGGGEALILLATLFWAVEVVIAKRLLDGLPALTVGLARMGLGAVLLLGWVAATGRAGQLVAMDGRQWTWALVTGVILAAYVATWFAALARAGAVDVTAVLVLGAIVTALLDAVVNGKALVPQSAGLALVAAGVLLMVAASARRARTPTVGSA